MVVSPALINEWIKIPDFARGLLMGTGITMEIISIIKMQRGNRPGASY